MSINPRRFLTLIFALLLCGCNLAVYGDKLPDFEKDATTHNDNHEIYHHESDNKLNTDSNDDDNTVEQTLRVLLYVIDGGIQSFARVADPVACRKMHLSQRSLGEPTLPFLRFESSYRLADASIQVVDLRSEVGIGPLGMQYNISQYTDHSNGEKLSISEEFGLYRMTACTGCEFDLGGGCLTLDGVGHTSQPAGVASLLIHPKHAHIGLELRVATSEGIKDYDLGFLYTSHYSSLKFGYRAVVSPHDALKGPYIGLAFRL